MRILKPMRIPYGDMVKTFFESLDRYAALIVPWVVAAGVLTELRQRSPSPPNATRNYLVREHEYRRESEQELA